jgi:hypothetical protein
VGHQFRVEVLNFLRYQAVLVRAIVDPVVRDAMCITDATKKLKLPSVLFIFFSSGHADYRYIIQLHL